MGTGLLFGSDYTPELVLHRGAGAYICGEETALLSSLNGFRGQPTAKPPFPAVSGAFQRPTLLNNVETLATVPYILADGRGAVRRDGGHRAVAAGRACCRSPATSSGPGNYELPFTATLRDLIEGGGGGGVPDGRGLKAIIPGGSSSPFLGPEGLEVGLRDRGAAAPAPWRARAG